MSSQIIETNPTSGSATTSSVRDNFGFAKTEISELQRMTEDRAVTGGGADAQTADFANDVVLAEGVRITVEIGSGLTTTSTTPTLNVDSTGAKTIVRQDGSALVAGDLKAGQYVDLIYDATATKWVWLNSNTSANNASPAFTGTPTAPTASKNTNTTQLATTAFVMAQTASETESGIAELADAAEVKAGTDAARILTPANLLREAVVNTVSGSGVPALGDQGSIEIAGVIIKFGYVNVTGSSPFRTTVTFSNAFDNHIFTAYVQSAYRFSNNSDDAGYTQFSINSHSASSITIQNRFAITTPVFWLAIGG